MPKETTMSTYQDHLVSTLPLIDDLPKNSYAGYIPIKAGKLFYWLFHYQGTNELNLNIPLIIWLNGGPGCSSLIGEFLETGSINMNVNGTIKNNPYSFSQIGHVLYIDQPVGTGLSFAYKNKDLCKNDESCNEQFYEFIQNFLNLHDYYYTTKSNGKKISRDIYFTGESHAGHSIPSLTKYIMIKNHNLEDDEIKINIKALFIGNGWIDPNYQYDVSQYAHRYGLISNPVMKSNLLNNQKTCQSYLKRNNFNHRACYRLLDDVVAMTKRQGRKRVLIYDVRKFVLSDAYYPAGHTKMEEYLNRKDVRIALHATETPHKFDQCTDPPYFALKHQDGKGVVSELISILESNKIDVVFFTGVYDLVCNYVSLDKALENMKWTGQKLWNQESIKEWNFIDNQNGIDGYVRNIKKLTHYVIMDAGHMVAMDRKETTLQLLETYIDQSKKLSINIGESISTKDYYDVKKLVNRKVVKKEAPFLSSDIMNKLHIINTTSINNNNHFIPTANMNNLNKNIKNSQEVIIEGNDDAFPWTMYMVIALFICYLTLKVNRNNRDVKEDKDENQKIKLPSPRNNIK